MRRKLLSLLALFALAAVALVVVVLPTGTLMPFRYHTPEVIERLYALQSWGSTISFVLLVIGVLVAVRMWKERTSLWAPLVSTVPVVLLVVAAFFSRQNLVEWAAFAPIEAIEFEAVAAAGNVAESEYVMGVAVGDEARAYPILMVAYYHIVNDEIDGEPFAVTY